MEDQAALPAGASRPILSGGSAPPPAGSLPWRARAARCHPLDHRRYSATMPLSFAQARVLIAAAHDHAVANGWKIAVAVVDEGGLLVALGRMDGAFPLSAQIAEAKQPAQRYGTATASSSPPVARLTKDSSMRSAGLYVSHSFQVRAQC